MLEPKLPPPKPELIDGLAFYRLGEGAPVFLMPDPDGLTFGSSVTSSLARQLCSLGRQVITFDPSGSFQSTRPATVTMEDLLGTSREVLAAAGLTTPVDFAAEGWGAVGALAFTLETPQQVKSLALVGGSAGLPAIRKYGGLPWCLRRTSRDYWRFIAWERRLSRGGGSLQMHKRLQDLIARHAAVRPEAAFLVNIEAGDKQQPPPARDRWRHHARSLNYRHASRQIQVPTLLCVGRFDRVAPVGCSHELAQHIQNSWLMIFENSGHAPQDDEPEALRAVLAEFWQT